MGKTSPLTGTGKKARKAEYKAHGYFAEESVRQSKHDRSSRNAARKDIRDVGKGKGLPKYDKVKYEKQSLHGLQKDFKRAMKGADKIFEPTRQEALANFDQYTTPEVANSYGRESGGGSSALNQAMAAARGNLQRGLAADFAGVQANLANNFLNQREQSRQFGAQFQSGQNQFANQSQLANLNTRLQANSGLMGNPIQPIGGGLQQSYNPSTNKGPNGYQQMAGSIIEGGLTALGTMYGGPPGGIAANKTASWGTNQLGLS